MHHIINLREHPAWLERAADYFSARWRIDRQLYIDSMTDSLSTALPVPRWYLMLRGDAILGGCGLIDNDFMVRTDLSPWLCALYIEPEARGHELGAHLLAHVRHEAAALGIDTVYLNTDHVSYYERYGWRYLGDFPHQSGENARVYAADAQHPLEEMAAFFNARAESYDSHMLDDLGLDDFYRAIAACFTSPVAHLLDLGCGTGLELDALFERFPHMPVTGIDMAADMLKQLAQKHADKRLRLICGSYFDEDFGGPYSHVLSTYSLHHFSETSKAELYGKIHAALMPGGRFIFGDYTVLTIEQQEELLRINAEKRREQGLADDAFYHFDTPFTAETEVRLMRSAGFASADIMRQWDNTSIIVAGK